MTNGSAPTGAALLLVATLLSVRVAIGSGHVTHAGPLTEQVARGLLRLRAHPSRPVRAASQYSGIGLYSPRRVPSPLRAEEPEHHSDHGYVLNKFATWFEATQGRPPMLPDFTRDQVRFFLVDAQEKPKWQRHPLLEGVATRQISSATLHTYVRSLQTFGTWPQLKDYAVVNPLAALRLPKLDQKQLQPLTEERNEPSSTPMTTTTPTTAGPM